MKTYNHSFFLPLMIGGVASLFAIGLMTKPSGQANQPIMALLCSLLAAVAFLVAFLIKRQPPALVVSPEGVVLRESLFGSSRSFSWDEVTQVHYVIEATYSVYQYLPRREVRFMGKGDVQLACLRLNGLAGADFNDIYEYASSVAPHIIWRFPK